MFYMSLFLFIKESKESKNLVMNLEKDRRFLSISAPYYCSYSRVVLKIYINLPAFRLVYKMEIVFLPCELISKLTSRDEKAFFFGDNC